MQISYEDFGTDTCSFCNLDQQNAISSKYQEELFSIKNESKKDQNFSLFGLNTIDYVQKQPLQIFFKIGALKVP